MKSLLLITLAVLIYAVPVFAQDRIELWADQNRSTCTISEPISPPIVQIHIFINGPVGATGVRFTAEKPGCWLGATWLGDALVPGAVNVSNSQNDWSIAFGGCTLPDEPSYLGAISYLITNQALPCCVVDALPAGQLHYFMFTDCNFGEHPLEPTRSVIVNPNENCGCQSSVTSAVAVTSWGRVKALYR